MINAAGRLNLLRRHVVEGAENLPCAGHLGFIGAHDAEIHDFGHALGGQNNIGGLDIPMHHTGSVNGLKTRTGLKHDPGALFRGQGCLMANNLVEGLPLGVLHGDKGGIIG